MKIYADSSEMHRIADEITLLSQELQNNMTRIEDLFFSLEECWKGESGKSLVNSVPYLKKELSVIIAYIKECAYDLDFFAEQYESYDDELTKKIKRI